MPYFARMAIMIAFTLCHTHAATLTVGKGGGFDHSTITSAMTAAGPGDTLHVEAGVYDTTGGEVFPIQLKNEIKLLALDTNPPTLVGNGLSSILEGHQLDGFNMRNFILTGGGGLKGGALYLATNSEASIVDCTFTNHTVIQNRSIENSGLGHAIHLDHASLSVRSCTFRDNGFEVPTINDFVGWAIASVGSSGPSFLLITETVIDQNSGAIACRDQSNLVLVNSLIVRNRFQTPSGLGSAVSFQSGGVCEVNGCTLAGNLDGGIHLGTQSSARIENSILWNYGREIFGSTPFVAACCIRGGFNGPTTVSDYPEFVAPGEANWRLADGSPLIDRGGTAFIRNGVTTDLDGNDRVRGVSVDIGAYEAPAEFVASPGETTPKRLYVRQATAESKTGQSWEEAFPTIWEAMLESQAGDEIWVASGTYTETISLTSEISLIGGFAGTETSIEERDLSAHKSVIDATGLNRSVVGGSESEGFLMDGLTLTGGRSDRGGGFSGSNGFGVFRNCCFTHNYARRQGGGIYAGLLALDFFDCEFRTNRVKGIRPESGGLTDGDGGGIYYIMGVEDGLVLRRCRFHGNKATWTGMCITISSSQSSSPSVTLDECVLTENSNFNDNRDSNVLSCNREIDFHIHSTMISHNSASADFPFLDSNVIGSRSGGGLANVTLVDSEISHNAGMRGIEAADISIEGSTINHNSLGGILFGEGVISNSSIQGNGNFGLQNQFTVPQIRILNTTISGNGHGHNPFPNNSFGSGVLLRAEQIEMEGCRIFDNVGFQGLPGGGLLEGGNVRVTNTEVYGNLADFEFNAIGGLSIRGDAIQVLNSTFADNRKEPFKFSDYADLEAGANQSLVLLNTIVWNASRSLSTFGGIGTIEYCNLSDGQTGTTNLSEDPLFLHPWDGLSGDYRLPCHSPCVDSGTSEGAPEFDIEGISRPRGAGVDMGAYENCHFDLNGDGAEDVKDLISFPSVWYDPANETNFGFNVNRSGVSEDRIDSFDLDELLNSLAR